MVLIRLDKDGRRLRRIVRSKPRRVIIGGIHGYLFPCGGIRLNRRLAEFSASHSGNLNDLPIINVSRHFHNPRNIPIMQSTVSLHDRDYLIAAFYDPALDLNSSLRALRPGVQWRGALAIFSVGSRVNLLSRPQGPLNIIIEAVCLYMERVKYAINQQIEIPRMITRDG